MSIRDPNRDSLADVNFNQAVQLMSTFRTIFNGSKLSNALYTFSKYGKIQSVKLQAAKDNGGTGTATVAFNDIKSAAKAHHANNSLGETTLRTDYWEGSTQTPVLATSAPPLGGASSSGGSGARGVVPSGSSYANPPATRPVSSFASWAKGLLPCSHLAVSSVGGGEWVGANEFTPGSRWANWYLGG
ncbi:split ends-like protein [Elysia marginata]|uniref:Split ends-like protein n=1 Tax=Elysia marginata TaxID=1093978 RepID=A0AAV4IBF8_9GAST|nr:split ends-like protein [Elysia marginata]